MCIRDRTMVAVWILGVNIIGMGVGSFFTGYLVDYVFNDFSSPYTLSLISIGLTSVLAIICYYIASLSYTEDIERVNKS